MGSRANWIGSRRANRAFDLESARHLFRYDAWAILNLVYEEKSRLASASFPTVDGTAIYVTSNDEPPSVTDVRHRHENSGDVAFTMPDEFTLKPMSGFARTMAAM